MSVWLSRILEQAQKDKNLAKKLSRIAELDSKLMPSGLMRGSDLLNRMESQSYHKMAMESSRLCDEVAREVAAPDEDPDEIANWISYNCGQIARQLPRKRRLW